MARICQGSEGPERDGPVVKLSVSEALAPTLEERLFLDFIARRMVADWMGETRAKVKE